MDYVLFWCNSAVDQNEAYDVLRRIIFKILNQTIRDDGCNKLFFSSMELKGKPSETKSGRKIKVFANIGSVADVASVQEYDAEDIGLFRSDEWLEAVSDAEYGKLE